MKKQKRAGRPPKEGSKKSERVVIAVEPERKDTYQRCADIAGLELSVWARLVLDEAANVSEAK